MKDLDQNLPTSALSDSSVQALTDKEKITHIAHHFRQIIGLLGLDEEAGGLRETPRRVAKMYVEEIFSGLNPENKPNYKLFDNSQHYHGILLQQNISFFSSCEHHFVPIQGLAHVAYIPKDKIIGLSKINRLVQYFARRPQVQERLTEEIAQEMRQVLDTQDVAVMIVCQAFLCLCPRRE